MPNQLSNPLQNLIAKAGKSLPSKTGETARFESRFQGAGTATVIVCDTSGSMDAMADGRRKIDLLREALRDLVRNDGPPVPWFVLWFSSVVGDVPVNDHSAVPEPSGGTAMHLGLDTAGAKRPAHTIVISDGLPDSEESALAAAERLPGRIDVIYCGPESDAKARAFMDRLARTGCGTSVVHDFCKGSLTHTVRKLLALPSPKRGQS